MNFDCLDGCLERQQYPATSAELISAHGDRTIELQDGTETVGEVLARLDDQTYDHADDVYTDLRSAVGHEAIGRRGYSDRDAPTLGESGPTQVSF
ncbi:MAG: DUF2795 domain-containing protein [Haloferacaceae archaeon]